MHLGCSQIHLIKRNYDSRDAWFGIGNLFFKDGIKGNQVQFLSLIA
jgi:hypothetical protein